MLQHRDVLTVGFLFVAWCACYSALGDTLGTAKTQSKQASPPATHPWWSLTLDQARAYFNEGMTSQRSDEADDPMAVTRRWYARLDIDERIDTGVALRGVILFAPPFALRFLGAKSEREMMDQDEQLASIRNVLKSYSASVDFGVLLASPLDTPFMIREVKFKMETDKGTRVSPTRLPKPDVGVSGREYTAGYAVTFPLQEAHGAPYVTPKTKWLRLWILTMNKKTSVTFSLAPSEAAKITGERPITVVPEATPSANPDPAK